MRLLRGARVAMRVILPKALHWKFPNKPAVQKFRHIPAKDEYGGLSLEDNHRPHFGRYGLQALEEAWITSKQVEDIRRLLVRVMERKGKLWIRVFPHQAITQRVAESRMGASKGKLEYWVAVMKKNFVIFEVDCVPEEVARKAFRQVANVLPMKTRMVIKEDLPSAFALSPAGAARHGG